MLRDVIGWDFVEAHPGWLIFALPPAELAVHPAAENFVQKHADRSMLGAVLYLMCDDLKAMMKELAKKGVQCSATVKAEWGTSTSIRLPSGGEIGLYQPTHETALGLSSKPKSKGRNRLPAKKH